MTVDRIAKIKLVCFDSDGVTKRRGTEFGEEGGRRVMKTYGPSLSMREKLEKLSQKYAVCITSGRSMSYLRSVYGEKWILQSEIGMFTYRLGKIKENTKLTDYEEEALTNIYIDLRGLLSNPVVKGFEPKERIVTLHCQEEVPEVRKMVAANDPKQELDCWWNGEAYDILPKRVDKGFGIKVLLEDLGLNWAEVMTVGNGINDEEMTARVGLSVTTDKQHLNAEFGAEGEEKGGEAVVEKMLELSRW